MTPTDTISKPITTVDAVVLTIEDDELKVLLHRRTKEPFKDQWALPGGFIHVDKDADAESAIQRVMSAKTGVTGVYMEQLQTYSGPDRDPRGWSVSIAHLALVPRDLLGDMDPDLVALMSVDNLSDLAFDHATFISSAVARLRGKGAYSTLPASFLGAEFTLGEIQKAYEVALDTKLDHSSFRRKIMDLQIIEDTGKTQKGDNRRPAKVYRLVDEIKTFDRTLGSAR